jgi:superfamily I DNA and/or RNA helicase
VNELQGGAETLLREFLNASPVYALQGPPGTGKTTIAARAVRAMLIRHPEARILVSAQSHVALDHLAGTIMRWVGPDVTGVRIVSQHTKEKVQLGEIYSLLPEPQASAMVERIRLHCQKSRDVEPRREFKEILERWLKLVDESELELRDRLRQGANLVFATCSGATDYALGTNGARPSFDWVIIEEAAKAWPTELVVPLLQGRRWTLIGDHRQLPAYRRREVGEFLAECAGAPIPELRRMGERSREFEQFFDLFGYFFTQDGAESHTDLRRASGRLSVQHRMERRLGDLVGSVFYDASLRPGRNADARHEIDDPHEFTEQSVVWIDTSEIQECHDDAPIRRNRAEAAIVAEVVRRARLHPLGRPGPHSGRSAVILTPYRKQIDLLTELRDLPEAFRSQIYTVDSFQGREAEVVVVSMVRSSQQEPNSVRAIGFLAELQRMNVLFSRARSLLVVVGNLTYFEKAGALADSYDRGGFWPHLAQKIRSGGASLVSARRFLHGEDFTHE